MTRSKAAQIIIDTCHKLLAERLVARTWGNVSVRLSDEQFLITPSGRDYLTLTQEDLVAVNIADLSYDGDIKPSSEKGIHAYVYRAVPEAGIVIHTHQFFASVIAAAGQDTDEYPCAAYGLPGTGKLMKNAAAAITAHPDKSAFLMEKHGALIYAPDAESAIDRALAMEEYCRTLFAGRTGLEDAEGFAPDTELKPWLDDFAQIAMNSKAEDTDDPEAFTYIAKKNAAAAAYADGIARPMGYIDSHLQKIVYKTKYSKLKNK